MTFDSLLHAIADQDCHQLRQMMEPTLSNAFLDAFETMDDEENNSLTVVNQDSELTVSIVDCEYLFGAAVSREANRLNGLTEYRLHGSRLFLPDASSLWS